MNERAAASESRERSGDRGVPASERVGGSAGAKPPGLYLICQIAGWGSFLAYVLIAYLLTAPTRSAWDVVSIVFFNGVVCPAITHGLRHWMHTHQWLQLPIGRLSARLAAFCAVTSALLTLAVVAGIKTVSTGPLPVSAVIGMFFGFLWAFTGWVVIYYVVYTRRRRDALQLELAVVSRDAQLRSLRAQLNPHFLFNCLNSLRHLIATDPKRAESMVTGLSELLRYSLASDRKDVVPLAEELEVVDEYLALEQTRFEERLRVTRDIDPASRIAQIPPMLVQTLVENAVKHGISTRPEGGVISIRTRVADGRLELTVANSGAMARETDTAGHGLRNARERLRLLYDGAASLTLTNGDGMTHATLTAPLRASEADLKGRPTYESP